MRRLSEKTFRLRYIKAFWKRHVIFYAAVFSFGAKSFFETVRQKNPPETKAFLKRIRISKKPPHKKGGGIAQHDGGYLSTVF